MFTHGMDDLVESLRSAKKTSLLIGAGCSKSAGIPTASEIVEAIKTRYPQAYLRAKVKDYPHCMAELSASERHALIKGYVEKSKINWAHHGIAQLMKHDKVQRVLTVNFDNLILRACALQEVFPAVYDIASMRDGSFKPERIYDKAIFHLHGQYNGFIFLNTEKECKEHAGTHAPIVQKTTEDHMWIVVGYSGKCDPVFQHLAKLDLFPKRLYWIDYNNSEPEDFLRTALFNGEEKDVHYIGGYDADAFFIELCQKLEIFPPEFITSPFAPLKSFLDDLPQFPEQTGQDLKRSITAAQDMVNLAIKTVRENKTLTFKAELESAVMSKDSAKIEKLLAEIELNGALANVDRDILFWAFVVWGGNLRDQAKSKVGPEADSLYSEAYAKYQKAVEIKPDKHEAYNNWGNGLTQQAEPKVGPEADILYNQACAKYQKALEIKPDMHEAYNNWGYALTQQAKPKDGPEADSLYNEAYAKYQKAVEIKPDKHETYYNWGGTLRDQAKSKDGSEADSLYNEAYAKYQKAVEIKPDKHEAYNNWGSTLLQHAKSKKGPEADTLYNEVYDKYQKAVEIKPDKHEAYYNWANALSQQAKSKEGPAADTLYNEAYDKYQKAVEIKPDMHEAYYNWGNALLDQAELKDGPEAEILLKKAEEMFAKAKKLQAVAPETL